MCNTSYESLFHAEQQYAKNSFFYLKPVTDFDRAVHISSGANTRPMPGQPISLPSVDTAELAQASIFLRAVPEAPVNVVADNILQTLPAGTPSSEARADHQALEFGSELLRQTKDQLAWEI